MEAKPPAPELKSPLVPLDSAAAVDETAQIETTLTEGLRTLRAEGLKLHEASAPCDLIVKSLLSVQHLGAVA